MARTLEVLASRTAGMGDESFSHLSIGVLILSQLLIAMSIISFIVFACADGVCCDAGKEKTAENDQEKKDDDKNKPTNEVTITCCGGGDGDCGGCGGGSGCGGGCGGD